MVMSSDDAPVSAHAVAGDFGQRWKECPSPTEIADEPGTAAFQVGAHTVIIGAMPAPIPWSELEGPCSTTILWDDAATEVRAHRSHQIVTVLAELPPLELAALLTRAVASTLAAMPGAIGVYWGSAPLIAPRALFIELAEQTLPQRFPLPLWVDFRIWRERRGAAGFTSGLAALGAREIEVASAPEQPSELYDRLFNLADYVLSHPDAIQDGHTVGRDANEKVRVEFGNSSFGLRDTVMKLHFAGSKPWWRPF